MGSTVRVPRIELRRRPCRRPYEVVSPRIGVIKLLNQAMAPAPATVRGARGGMVLPGPTRPGERTSWRAAPGSNPGASTRPARAAHREQDVDLRLAARSPLDPEGVQKPLTTAKPGTRREVSPGTSRAGQSAQRLSDMSSGAQAARHGPPRKGPWPDGTGPGLAPPSPTAHRRPQNPLGLPVGTGERDEPLRSFRERPAPPARPRPPTTATLTHPNPPPDPTCSRTSSRTSRQDPQGPLRGRASGGPERLGAAASTYELLVLHNGT